MKISNSRGVLGLNFFLFLILSAVILLLPTIGTADLAAGPSPEKEACMAGVREQYRVALAECMKKPFGPDRNRCRDRADRSEAAGRAACRKQRPPASSYQ